MENEKLEETQETAIVPTTETTAELTRANGRADRKVIVESTPVESEGKRTT